MRRCWIRGFSGCSTRRLIRRFEAGALSGPGQYLELTISASHEELRKGREEILESALEGVGELLSAGSRGEAGEVGCSEGGAGYVLRHARAGSVSAGECGWRWVVSGGGLDADGVAFDDGGRGSERAAGSGGGCAGEWSCAEVYGAGSAADRLDAFAGVSALEASARTANAA